MSHFNILLGGVKQLQLNGRTSAFHPISGVFVLASWAQAELYADREFPRPKLEFARMSVATFATLINQKVLTPSSRTNFIAVDRDHFVDFLKPTLRRIVVDDEWYLKTNPDIALAIASGVVANAGDHYVSSGYYEHRMPYEITIDENWYLAQYSDVRDAVSRQLFRSARDHYYVAGFKEGRIPFAGFALRTTA